MASAAAAWPAKDYEIPRLGTTGKLEDSHSGVLAGSETGLLPQAMTVCAMAMAEAPTTLTCCVWVACEGSLPAFGFDHPGVGSKALRHPHVDLK